MGSGSKLTFSQVGFAMPKHLFGQGSILNSPFQGRGRCVSVLYHWVVWKSLS